MALTPMSDFTFKHVNQPGQISGDPDTMKENMDSQAVAVRTYINGTLKTEVDLKASQASLTSHMADNASETVNGHVELATSSETIAGTDNTRAVHPVGLKAVADTKLPLAGGTLTGAVTLLDNIPIKLVQGSDLWAFFYGGDDYIHVGNEAKPTVFDCNNKVRFYKSGSFGINFIFGSGSPEGVVTADIGSLYFRIDGGVSTTLYVKQSGTGNTGWGAK